MKKWGITLGFFFLVAVATVASAARTPVASNARAHLSPVRVGLETLRARAAESVADTGFSPASPSTSPSAVANLGAVAVRPSNPSRASQAADVAAAARAGSFGPESLHGQRGITLTVQNEPNFASKVGPFLDHVASLGVNSLNMMVWFRQSTDTSSDPTLTSYTATPQQMQLLITAAHQRGMSVMIRPIMDDGNLPQWRGLVLPTDPNAWIGNYYQNVIRPYATLNGVNAVDIGSELATLADKDTGYWRWLISTLRSALPGVRLTYSSTDWIALPGQQQPYPTFADSLDLIGVDAFFPLNGVTNGYDITQLVAAWQPSLGKVNRLATYYHKPVIFTELGLASQCCTLGQPFLFNSQAAPNLQAQATYYAAACRAIRPWHIGLYWWDYDGLDPLASPSTNNGFSPYGKPAEQEMARCFQSGY